MSLTSHLRALALLATCGGVALLSGATTASAAPCSNEAIREEQGTTALPDCRAYEMVSPLEKGGGGVSYEFPGGSRASLSGEAVSYEAWGSFASPLGAGDGSRYLSRRGPAGWSTQNIIPPFKMATLKLSVPLETLLFTPELSAAVVFDEDTALAPNTPEGYEKLYVADFAAGSYRDATPLVPSSESPFEAEGPQRPYEVGASTDLNRVVFSQPLHGSGPAPLLKGAHLYESEGELVREVDITPGGSPFPGGAFAGSGLFTVNVIEREGDDASQSDVWHAVSADGSRVFFTQRSEEILHGKDVQLYARLNSMQPQSPVSGGHCTVPADACTVEVSASQRSPEDPNGPQRARYWGASADGSEVYFTSTAELTQNANTGPDDNASNLYEYDLEDGTLTDLTVNAESEGARVLGVVTASEDASHIYFVAAGKLASNQVENGAGPEEAQAGQPNLYLRHGGATTFVATLADADEKDWEEAPDSNKIYVSMGTPVAHTVRVTPDGAHLAFQSTRSLTGYDNVNAGACGGACNEVYLYDAASGHTVCASCNPAVPTAEGPSALGGYGRGISQYPSPFYTPRNLSEDGSRLFLEGPEGTEEYEGGQMHPIGGRFMDASADGDDVFIATPERLTPAFDTDSLVDLYDVRVDGGFPEPETTLPCESAEACHAGGSHESPVPSPGTSHFQGPENPPPLDCKKGFALKNGHCVKVRKHRKKAKRHARRRADHNRGGDK